MDRPWMCCIVLTKATRVDGWAEAARLVRERGEDGLVDEVMATDFDAGEWSWE